MSAADTTSSNRLEIVVGPRPQHAASFAEDVRNGLCAERKRLQAKYFYDEVGSALFDAITVLPEYYLTRVETAILREWGWEIVRALGNPVEFLELGSGSAVKTRILIEEALRVQQSLRYSPIDISAEALRASAQSLVTAYPALTVTGYVGDYFTILGTAQLRRPKRTLAMFMGSNIGNYEPDEAQQLLAGIGSSLKPGDGLLLGTDLRKDSETIVRAYSDAAGVTAAFNKNLLCRINRELGGTFDTHDFDHVAEYDANTGCVSSYLTSRRRHSVIVAALDLEVAFGEGERVHVESSYKFSEADLGALGDAAGLTLARAWTDAEKRFSVNLYVKR